MRTKLTIWGDMLRSVGFVYATFTAMGLLASFLSSVAAKVEVHKRAHTQNARWSPYGAKLCNLFYFLTRLI